MKRGFTLVEILISSFLLLLVAMTLLALLSRTLRSVSRADFLVQAESIAQERLASARSQSLKDLPLGKAPLETVGSFQRQLEVLAVAGYEVEQLKELRVVVQWQESGRQRSMTRSVHYSDCSD